MQVLYLLRHGETGHNADGRIQGHTESDLSELGQEQARRLGSRLEQVPFTKVYASSLSRAMQTAEIAFNGRIPLEGRDGLKEMNLGIWEGRSAEELRRDFPAEVKQWFHEPTSLHIEGGETIAQFRVRVTAEMESIRTDHPDEILAVVAHGGVICTYLTHLLGMKLDDIWRFKIRNCSVTRIVFPQNKPRIDLLGDIHHLDGAINHPPVGSFRMFP